MEVVVKLPDEMYERIKGGYVPLGISLYLQNGTPLPKGHGDIVDRDAINNRFYDIWKELESHSNKPTYKELLDKWSMCMDSAQAIIEADKEV